MNHGTRVCVCVCGPLYMHGGRVGAGGRGRARSAELEWLAGQTGAIPPTTEGRKRSPRRIRSPDYWEIQFPPGRLHIPPSEAGSTAAARTRPPRRTAAHINGVAARVLLRRARRVTHENLKSL